jgi:hypothetical protein
MLPGQIFATADDVHIVQAERGGMVMPTNRAAEIPARMWWSREDVPFFLPEDTADAPLAAYVNHGRWVVMCECGGAQLASKDDPRFFCVSCLNESHGAKWRPVTWPKPREVAAIEGQLRPRLTENANWLPGETVDTLQAENERNGVTNGVV